MPLHPKPFLRQLLDESKLPLTIRQFWWYSFWYWSIFALVTLWQLTMLWLAQEGTTMRIHEMLIWLLDGLFWWSTSPLILYTSLRIPIAFHSNKLRLVRAIFLHLLIVTFLNIFINVFHYYITNAFLNLAINQQIPLEKYFLSFYTTFTASFGQYMLLVVGFNKVSYIYQYQTLKQQHLEAELSNEQLRGQLAYAQLQSLKMQLNPHFLFNTLHAVVSLMISNDIRKATVMITTLSDLLRAVLINQKADFIPLQEELKLTRQYLDIQQIRFQDRLKVEYDIDPATQLFPVPQLILQPLVENSITHGIADLSTNAVIRITSEVQGRGIKVKVMDNGAGAFKRKAGAGMGLGLKNTSQRLRQAFGEQARLLFEHPETGGTEVTLIFEAQPTHKLTNPNEILLSDH